MRILIVEDDPLLGHGLCTSIAQEGYEVEWEKNGLSAYKTITDNPKRFDLIILDLGLPSMGGMTILESIRNHGITIPVLILTAEDTTESTIKALDYGADDYLTKICDLKELYARIRALSRRGESRAENKIVYGDVVLDLSSHTITRNNEHITLSRREFSLLQRLIECPGRVLSREHLAQYIYDPLEDYDSNVLEVHIHNLRKKLNVDFIRTIRGVGYMIDKIENISE